MTIPRSALAGLILVGGESSRMGSDKVVLSMAGKPLWQVACSILEPMVDRVIFIDAGPALRIPETYRVLRDDPPGYGPLGGLATGLEKSGYRHHLLLAVDYPLVRPSVLRLLLERADDVWAVCGRSPSFLEPLLAYYNAACAPVIRGMIAEGEIRTHKLIERVPSIVLNANEYDAVDPRRLSQINVNTPGDLQRATAIYQEITTANNTRRETEEQ